MKIERIGASELASIITESICATFTRLGIVSVQSQPNTVPPVTPPVTRASVKSAPSIAHHAGQSSKVSKNVPAFGDFHCFVGQNARGERVDRAKLPQGMFEGFSSIIVNLPDGTWEQVNLDSEGRGRLSKGNLDKLRVPANSTLVFTSVGEGIFDLFVGPSDGPSIPVAPKATKGPKLPTAKASAPSIEALFANVAPTLPTGKKPRSAAQLANDERLRQANAAARTMAQSNTPQYVVVPPKGKQVKVEATRAANRQNAGNNQKAFAGIPTATRKTVEAPIYNVPESFRKNGRK